ncbi:hypothetical protein DFH06DRAFT_1132603 [Mycena polygramma]|nr:hypothetical protein DFH06DRAFT_1132603 [Mycena polygramma]
MPCVVSVLTYNFNSFAQFAVTKEEFEATVAGSKRAPGRVDTPAEDAQVLGSLLGVPPEKLGETSADPGEGENAGACGQCGRAFSFLDVAATGVHAHGKEFIVDILTGKHGHILNPAGRQAFNCHGCGTKAPRTAQYWNPWYWCWIGNIVLVLRCVFTEPSHSVVFNIFACDCEILFGTLPAETGDTI